MTLKLTKVSRVLRDEDGVVVRDAKRHPLYDDFFDKFDDEVVRLLLLMLAERRWTGNRFEIDLLGTTLFLRRVKNRRANGWQGWGKGTEIGRDGQWKILISSFDHNQVSSERARKILDIGWKNLTPQDDYDLAPMTDVMGYRCGLAGVIDATEFQGARDVFEQDMMIMRLYSTDQ